MHRNSVQRANTVFTGTWKDWPLANSSLSNYLCPWPVLGVDTSNTTGTTGVKLKLMLHLLISAIALAAANLVCAEALFMIVYRVLSTTNVAAIVAERKRGEIHFRSITSGHLFNSLYSFNPNLILDLREALRGGEYQGRRRRNFLHTGRNVRGRKLRAG